MFCPKCGEKVQEDIKFCPRCGTEITKPSPTRSVPTTEKIKWYNKTWFMWVMLIFIWPIGLVFLYRHRSEYSRNKLIAIFVCTASLFVFAQVSTNFNQPKQNTAQPVKTEQKTESHQVTKNDYFQLAEEAIAKHMYVPVVGMQAMDYWEMEHPDSGLADVKGTFKLNDDKKHSFRARFGIVGKELLLLKIDEKTILFDEEKQDQIMDETSAAKKKQ